MERERESIHKIKKHFSKRLSLSVNSLYNIFKKLFIIFYNDIYNKIVIKIML